MAVLGRLWTEPEVGLMVEHRDSETCSIIFLSCHDIICYLYYYRAMSGKVQVGHTHPVQFVKTIAQNLLNTGYFIITAQK